MNAIMSRWILLVAAVFAIAALPLAVAAQSTPAASPATATPGANAAVPATPAGDQLRWLLDQLNGETAIDASEIEQRFAPIFLDQVPAETVADLLSQLAASGPWTVNSIASAQNPYSLQAIIEGAAGGQRVLLSVEGVAPNRIITLFFQPAAVRWQELDQQLGGLGPEVSFLAAEIAGTECAPIHDLEPDRRLAIGSTFKLYVLGALARQIERGEASWDELLPIQDQLKSIPAGDLRYVPEGTEFTLRYFAELMISQSDNTATDHLIARVGRENVEAIMAEMGHGDPAVNIPFLTTRELFTIDFGLSEEARQAFRVASPEERRHLLETEVAAAALPPVEVVAGAEAADLYDELEWFASAEEICAALAYLHEQGQDPALRPVVEIMALNPGIFVDRATWPIVLFKGGSEPGVLNISNLLVRDDGRVFALVLTIADPAGQIDGEAAFGVMQQAAGLLAQSDAEAMENAS